MNVNRRLELPDGRVVVGRNWDGPVDRTVRVVRIDDLDEKPVATIVHYACHPTTIAWQSQHATPDYPGMAKSVVRDNSAEPVCSCKPRPVTSGRGADLREDMNVYRKFGRLLGLEASKLALGIETLPKREKLIGLQESGPESRCLKMRQWNPSPPRSMYDPRFCSSR